MRLERATEQLDSIWRIMARQQLFRGYRPMTVAATGVIGILAAMLQPWILSRSAPHSKMAFVDLWFSVAVISLVMVAIDLTRELWRASNVTKKKLTSKVVLQFLPAILAGGLFTVLAVYTDALLIEHLPGLWAICFALGIYSSLPYLPGAVGYVGLYFAICGFISLWLSTGEYGLSPWLMGITFGGGQLLSAVVLARSGRYDG